MYTNQPPNTVRHQPMATTTTHTHYHHNHHHQLLYLIVTTHMYEWKCALHFMNSVIVKVHITISDVKF